MTEPWNFTEAQRRQFREAQIAAKTPLAEHSAPDIPAEAVTHYTPEEHDQPECDADVGADPGTVMFGTLNPRKVTCPDCLAAMGPEPAPGEADQ